MEKMVHVAANVPPDVFRRFKSLCIKNHMYVATRLRYLIEKDTRREALKRKRKRKVKEKTVKERMVDGTH